jgi:hypothetical protein
VHWDGTTAMHHISGLLLPLVILALTVWGAFHQLRWDTVARRFPAPPIAGSAEEFEEFLYIVVVMVLDGRGRDFADCFISVGSSGLRIEPRAANGVGALIPWTAIEDVQDIGYVRQGSPRRNVMFTLTGGRGKFRMEEPAGTAAWIGWRMARGKPGRSAERPHDA